MKAKVKLKPIRTIGELHQLAQTDENYRYWYFWTVSNLGGPCVSKFPTGDLKKDLRLCWEYVVGACADLPEGEDDLVGEANWCRKAVEEEINNDQKQF